MKEIETIVTKYMANDGTRFDDKESCEKYETECLKSGDACANRIAMIRGKRKMLDDEAKRIKHEKELKLDSLQEHILSMKHRIVELISVGYELHKNKFHTRGVGMWVGCSSFGFLRNQNDDVSYVGDGLDKFDTQLNILYPSSDVYHGWCTFTVYTDGESIKYKFKNCCGCNVNGIVIDVKIELCEKFIKDFDDFETKLYKEIDEVYNVENAK